MDLRADGNASSRFRMENVLFLSGYLFPARTGEPRECAWVPTKGASARGTPRERSVSRDRAGPAVRTNPEINVIVYHRGNVIPDREDKWRRNTIRCTAVGRPAEDEEPSRSLVFTYRATTEETLVGRWDRPAYVRRDRDGTTEDERSETYDTSLRSPVVYDRRRTDSDFSSRNRAGTDTRALRPARFLSRKPI